MNLRTKRHTLVAAGLVAVLGLAGCATVPMGPAVTALPGQYKPWDQFRADDLDCRQFASVSIGAAGQAATDNATATAVGGTLLGAATGAAIGAASGQAGPGAAIGAGVGLLAGSVAGGDYAYASSYELQRRYDGAYMQCMYAKGNQIPVRGGAVPPRANYGYPPGTAMAPPGSQYAPPPGSQYAPPPGSQYAPPPGSQYAQPPQSQPQQPQQRQ